MKTINNLSIIFLFTIVIISLLSTVFSKPDIKPYDYYNKMKLNEFDNFSVQKSKIDNNQLILSLIPNDEIGFDFLEISANVDNYIPKSIKAFSGDELEIKVEILSHSSLNKPFLIKNKKLSAIEIIDLRE